MNKEPDTSSAQEVPPLTGHSPAAGQAELGLGTGSSLSHRDSTKQLCSTATEARKEQKARPKTKLKASLRIT